MSGKVSAHRGERLGGVQMLWHTGYYDGPTDGVAVWEGRFWWFTLDPDTFDADTRIYFLVELTNDEARYEVERLMLFERCVGTHTRHGVRGVVFPGRLWYRFFDGAVERDYTNRVPRGWFTV